jgi:hypothetical protein
MDKKFPCPHEGCGKSYSRAEHLYRHQLNRKSIYLCCCLIERLFLGLPTLIFKLPNSLRHSATMFRNQIFLWGHTWDIFYTLFRITPLNRLWCHFRSDHQFSSQLLYIE